MGTDIPAQAHDLAGRVAIISGGSSGIGRASARLLLQAGAKVVIFGRDERRLQEALDQLRPYGEVHGVTADSAYEDQIVRVFEETRRRFGDIHILINNAGLAAGSVLDTPYEDMLYVVRVNLLGYLTCIREAVGMMRNRGGGHIVNVGSMAATTRKPGKDIYVATKAAVQAVTDSLQRQLRDDNIRLTLVEPGYVGTSMVLGASHIEREVTREVGRDMLEAEDVAQAIYGALTQPPHANVLLIRIAPSKQPL